MRCAYIDCVSLNRLSYVKKIIIENNFKLAQLDKSYDCVFSMDTVYRNVLVLVVVLVIVHHDLALFNLIFFAKDSLPQLKYLLAYGQKWYSCHSS